ncbi:isoprenylcysteine carboxylmethyltransferase family protein [Flavobacteriaceae bacterium F89]|uniref:Isoprenylcysteine carboxylmethyltransferase family protein n=1 Tax=Cerina litoralis TaxID=2874477 RepID=A0AAE3JQ93_9FLAO|nr:isoprenylcysteine carboxylmethyltransferase family protein [Cerina litoralis]MCG2462915.1 isoprenylcysteine carboxylmethyltransferase family protein [Cerina litoralis]
MNSQILFKIGPPNLYKTCIILMLMIGVLPIKPIIGFPWNLLGLPILFFGIYVSLKAKKQFKKSKTPILPNASPIQLHQNGLYKFTRNPMYLGIVTGLIGIALLTTRVINFVFPIIYFFIMDRLFIITEEANLKKEFGKQFLDYKRQTRRWI